MPLRLTMDGLICRALPGWRVTVSPAGERALHHERWSAHNFPCPADLPAGAVMVPTTCGHWNTVSCNVIVLAITDCRLFIVPY